MVKASPAFTNFTAGQLSARLDGRTDIAKYANGCKQLQNFVVHAHGGATRRPGTEFIAEVKTSANATRLIPFEFNVEQTYILEFGNLYFRIYRDGGQVVSGGSAVEVATPYTSAQIADIKFTQSADVMYIVHPDHSVRKISRTGHTSWTITEVDFRRGPMLDQNTTTTTLSSSGLTGSVTVTASASLFAATDVGRLINFYDGFAKITAYSSATSVTAAVQENEDLRTELMASYTATTIAFKEGDPSSTGLEHNDRITDTGANFILEGFKVGQTVTISGASNGGNNQTALVIVQVTADTILFAPSNDLVDEAAGQSVTITGNLGATSEWSLGAFSTTTGFPSCVVFFEQRLVFANTATQPQTMFFSVSGDFEDFNAGTLNSSALIYTIGSNQVNVIRFLTASRALLVGTSGGEFVVRASSDEPISPTNTQILRQASYGSANIQPVGVANVVLFVQRAKRKLRELVYSFGSDSYYAPDLTILAENITEGLIKEITLQQEPDNIVWCVLENGKLIGMTYRREEEVVAWHDHIIGGSSGTATITVTDYANIAVGSTITVTKSDGTAITFTSEAAGSSAASSSLGWRPNTNNDTTADNIYTMLNNHADLTVANPAANTVTVTETTPSATGHLTLTSSDSTRLAVTSQTHALVESVASIPSSTRSEEEVYVVVQRTINGATKRYIERLKPIDFGTDVEDAFFVDSGLTYSGSAATTISGLSHLEGQTVKILGNGAAHTDKQVSSGAVTLDRAVTKAHIGLSYNSILQTMRIDAGGMQGTSQGKIKRVNDVTVRVYRSLGVRVGSSSSQTDLIPFRTSASPMDKAVEMFTGDKEVEFDGGYETDGHVVVTQSQALPLTVLALYPRLTTFDE